ncbi:thioredoxin [Halorarius litoreus]|uniref:thioredoxin n=1 Tax=Halorarius litoreus TaxID=2962676 RepID=UPI0020CBBF5D|nr:thioredoxin [Halorarius litoreus]
MSETDDELDSIREQKRKELEDKASKPETPDTPIHVEGQSHLDQLVADHDVVLVDFYADWCGPCKMLEPTIETLAAESDAVMAKVDIDAHQALAQQYRVQGVPTLYLFANGEPVEQMVGVQDKGTLEQKIAAASA